MKFGKFGAMILAAGLGTRMKSDLPKVLHPICGQPMLTHIIDQLLSLGVDKIVIIVSHGKEKVIQAISRDDKFVFIDQKKPLGTGHAVRQTEKIFKNFKGPVLILSGDAPAITKHTLQAILRAHQATKADLTCATADLPLSTPYGRIIRKNNKIQEIKEALDCSKNELQIPEMNLGLYCANPHTLFSALQKIKNKNAKKEYYLTDIVQLINFSQAFKLEDARETLGINNRVELAKMNQYMQHKINEKWMLRGVTLVDPNTTYIDASVKIGKDTVIEPGCHLKGKTWIGSGVMLKAGTIIEDSRVETQATVGPYARLRPKSHVKKGARVGNFVELKNTTLGENSKANHLTYLGDAVIGKNVNIGCGVITCNYDGNLTYQGKAKTVIGDNCFIGSDCQLIAPLRLQKGTFVASGSSVTNDAPKDSLVIARAKQITKKGYMKKMWVRAKKRKK
ncbi:MAG: UDP-N-acetylglucosamine diphosphorylase/glucosamine-1-phosphate N-acetyltransferase [Deltaproteobacteria bacterium RIFCSPHIGHO2_02_FULL_40_11]|nr:MAG: UDP-N-acetylglucosamine diphosphorylase/glucosamine-1-phosphate N-acetyltransferase [Deltaproteobacteria bacterium RIFCSPHIGHO2_02_FULL_40_11]